MAKVVWFAKGGGIAKMGPFKSQAEAARHIRLVKSEATRWAPAQQAEFPADAFVWPEELPR